MALTVTVEGVDRTESVVFNSLEKTDNLNQQVDTLRFKVRCYGAVTYRPAIGDEVTVAKGATRIFGGVVVRTEETLASARIVEYDVTCSDYSHFLRRSLVTERYEGMTATAIIQDIVATYAADFTTAGVDAGVPIASIAFNRLTVAECLQKLADALSYVWYVDYYKDVRFVAKNGEPAPIALSDSSGNYVYGSLAIADDLTQLKNSIVVQGGTQVSAATRTEYGTGDGTRVQFELKNKFASLPTVTVGGAARTVGVEFLDDDASFQVMWNYNEKYLRFTAGNTPAAAANNIAVTGFYEYPVVVSVPAPDSIAEFGVYEFAVTDTSISSQDEAVRRAVAELQAYQAALFEGSFRTYTDGLRSGQTLTIESAQRGRAAFQVVIQSVRARMRDPEGDTLEYDVRFATLKNVGIIEFLQRQLRDRQIVQDDSEVLLNFKPLSDTVAISDSLAAPSATSGPYLWDAPGTRWGYFTWS